ncbi:MAG: membrane integrity-associated transporter subunit PqiC, partial [Kiritimatiellae bacterium]|nr:membrane integrity-associated transporter subunit PqiC [Kiritimatiellia bacterium]
MTGRIAFAAALLLCAGCFTSSTPVPKTWVVSPTGVKPPAAPSPGAFSVTRQGTLTVTAPFDSTSFIVRRADGSVARDSYNVFASPPSTLLRAAVRARLEADGRFGRVVPQSSSASADVQVEVLVRDLSLDCSVAERRTARAAVSVDVLRTSRGARTVILSGDGAGTGDAAKGDYSAAFSQAFDAALVDALNALKAQPPPQ